MSLLWGVKWGNTSKIMAHHSYSDSVNWKLSPEKIINVRFYRRQLSWVEGGNYGEIPPCACASACAHAQEAAGSAVRVCLCCSNKDYFKLLDYRFFSDTLVRVTKCRSFGETDYKIDTMVFHVCYWEFITQVASIPQKGILFWDFWFRQMRIPGDFGDALDGAYVSLADL